MMDKWMKWELVSNEQDLWWYLAEVQTFRGKKENLVLSIHNDAMD